MRLFAQHFLRIAQPIVAAVTLALLPKCPACLAAYLMVATGVGISVAAAASLRAFVIVVCVSTLVLVAVKHILNLRAAA